MENEKKRKKNGREPLTPIRNCGVTVRFPASLSLHLQGLLRPTPKTVPFQIPSTACHDMLFLLHHFSPLCCLYWLFALLNSPFVVALLFRHHSRELEVLEALLTVFYCRTGARHHKGSLTALGTKPISWYTHNYAP